MIAKSKRSSTNTFVDWFLPLKLRTATPDEVRRARLTVVFCLAMALNSLPNLFVLLNGGVQSVAATVAAVTFVYMATPFLLRLTGSVRLSAHVLVTAGATVLLVSSAYSGGLASPGLVWWGATLIFAVMLLGTRVGLFWTVVAILACVVYIALQKNGIQLRNDVAHLDRAEALGSSFATAFVAFFLLVRVYEKLKESMLNEIGQARRSVEQAHQSARLVLDNVSQGLLVADASGRIGTERSEALSRWFGPISPTESIFGYFGRVNRDFAEWLEVGWSGIFDNFLPVDVGIAQLPTRFLHSERHYSVNYRPISHGASEDTSTQAVEQSDSPSAVLVVVTDITEIVMAERAEESQRELLAILQRAMSDRGILLGFIEESRCRVRALVGSTLESTAERRELHTLKGNAGLFGLIRIPRLCHEIEQRVTQEGRCLAQDERAALRDAWNQVEASVLPLLGEDTATIQLSMPEYHDVLDAVAQGESHSALHRLIRSWVHEPTHKRLGVLAEQATVLARRLGKGDVTVQVDDGGVRLPREQLHDFWSTFSHLLRNAIDHGLETPEERQRSGKPLSPRVELAARIERGDAIVEIADDGRGINWTAVAEAARAKGLPTQTKEQLEAALFVDGLTTRTEANDISGRGVGLSAVKSAVQALDGTISIDSRMGHGTRLSFRFRLSRLRPSIACPSDLDPQLVEATPPEEAAAG